jgi:murein L,D-transpeptidase YcbB/YkuD
MMTTKATIGAVAATAAIIAATTIPATAASAAPTATATAARATVTATALEAAVKAPQLQPWPVLRQGANSGWPKVTVRSLQYLLVAHGAKLAVNGPCGTRPTSAMAGTATRSTWTAATARRPRPGSAPSSTPVAQEIPGFPVDGIVGPRTWQALVTEALLG